MVRAGWIVALAGMTFLPVALTTWRADGSLARNLSVMLGVLGLSALVVVVLAPSRIRTLTQAFGVDQVMSLHRWLGILAIGTVMMHAVAAIAKSPGKLADPLVATSTAQVGWGSLLTLLLVGYTASRGRRPGARYELWARLHVALAAGGLVLGGLHVLWLGHLVDDPVMRVVLSLLALALLGVLSHRWVWRPLFSRQGAYVVYGCRREGPTVATLVLAPVHLRRGGMRFSPGQFVWLRLRRGVVGTEEHPFTIASSAQVTGRLELTIRADGDFTRAVGALPVGSKVWLDGPHGAFTAEDLSTDGLVLLAGGVGITPMMSMLRTLADRGDTRLHRIVVAQRGDEPLFENELAVLGRRLRLAVTPTNGRRIDAALLAGVLPDPAERQRLDYFVCGSPSVLAGSLAALEQLGVPATRVHTEQFGWTGPMPAPATAPGGRLSVAALTADHRRGPGRRIDV